MTKNLFKRISMFLCISIITILGITHIQTSPIFHVGSVEAFGDLLVDFHAPFGAPMFSLFKSKPGETYSHLIAIKNEAKQTESIDIKGIKTGGTNHKPTLETNLEIRILEGTHSLYGSGSPTGKKTLAQFFTESTKKGISIGSLSGHQQKQYQLLVIFPQSSGNEFQGKSVSFTVSFAGTTNNEKSDHDSHDEKHR